MGYPVVEVVHGIGTYTLRKMILEEISLIEYATFRESANPGSLIVELDVPDPAILKKYTE